MFHAIESTISTGYVMGEDVFIPRIAIIPTDMPFEFKRLQFLVLLAFAMSISTVQDLELGRILYVFVPDAKTETLCIKQICNKNCISTHIVYFKFSNMSRMQYRIFPGNARHSR
jgi:hypothetical protein